MRPDELHHPTHGRPNDLNPHRIGPDGGQNPAGQRRMRQISPLEAITAKEAEIRQRLTAARAQAEADKKAARTAAG